jgi:hypothetical protein
MVDMKRWSWGCEMSLESDRDTLIRTHRKLLKLQQELPAPQRQILEVLMHGAYADVASDKLPIIQRGAMVRQGIRMRKIREGK